MGQALNAKTLSSEIGISRTPVREALRRLEAKGLVEIIPHFGAYVRSLKLSEFIEMCAMRQALEGYLAGTAAQVRTDADLREIGSIVEAMARMTEEMAKFPELEEGLIEACGREDIRFHVAIMAAARNKFISREVLRLHLISRVAISNAPVIPEKTEDPVADHRERDLRRRFVQAAHEEILHAISDRNAKAARELMERHIQEIIDGHINKASLDPRLEKKALLSREEEFYIAG